MKYRNRNYNTFKYLISSPIFVVFNLYDLYSLQSFRDKMNNKLEINSNYLVLIKIRFTDNKYKMAGTSSGFKYENIMSFSYLYDVVLKVLVKYNKTDLGKINLFILDPNI